MKPMQQYVEGAFAVLNAIIEKETATIEKAAKAMAECIAGGHIVHVIGTGGHSYIVAEEFSWRAGGLAAVNPIFDPGVSLSFGCLRSMLVERVPGYARAVLDSYLIEPGDLLIIGNAYGMNSATIDSVLWAAEHGIKTIGITSVAFVEVVPPDHPARHPSKKNLKDLVDILINSHVPPGDAVVEIEGSPLKVAAVSTMANALIVNSLVAETVAELARRGITPPVWMSGNMPGGDEANRKNLEVYGRRVRHLL